MVIKYLAISLNQFGFCNTIPDPTGWFKNSKKGNIRRDELLLAMTNGADIPKVAEDLCTITGNHPLLCNRIWRVFRNFLILKNYCLVSKVQNYVQNGS